MSSLIKIQRIQEVELPKDLSVGYIAVNSDYQSGVQISQRIATESSNIVKLDLPIVLTDDEARQLAEKMHYASFSERNRYYFKTSIEHLDLDAGDVIKVNDGNQIHLIRITNTQIAGLEMIIEGVGEFAADYTNNATGGSSDGFTDQTVAVNGPTNLILMDIPILVDGDDSADFYIAAGGYTGTWRGCAIYKSLDSGASYALLDSLTDETTAGYATTALGDHDAYTIDNANTVTVTLYHEKTLSSTTEANLLNGANSALLGSEIIQFQTATLVSGSTYTLSGLVRGRKGTDWATSGHAVNDRFVLLSGSTLIRGSATTGTQREYKGVTIGNHINNAAAISFTNNSVGLKPYSPVHLAGTRDGSNNLTVTWIRRTRKSGEWADYSDVPLGEDSESYELEFWNTGETVQYGGTKTASSETYSYTAASQTSDGATPGQSFYVYVYQISATVGRGYVGKAII